MSDPDEERFVLLPKGIEGVVWPQHRHSGYLIQASDAVPGTLELPRVIDTKREIQRHTADRERPHTERSADPALR
jgi:hypothetical protein